MEKKRDLALLVYSCWKNSDMWEIFLQLFHKYWNDCPYELILLTDKVEKDPNEYGFDKIVVLDASWHDMILAGLKCAGTKYVMLFMDDYLLCDYVKNQDIEYYIGKADQYHAANIRFIESQMIKAEEYDKDEEFHWYRPGTAYSFSTQVGIWNVELLKKYMRPEWSAWDFERKGSLAIKDRKHPLLSPKDYVFPYEEGVRRGKWMENGVRVCERNHIKLDFNKRKRMTDFEMAWIYLKGGILGINPTLVVKIQNFLQR